MEFLLRDDEQMFEQQIAMRRQQIFKDQDTYAIEEMKKILQNYTKEKEEENKQNWLLSVLGRDRYNKILLYPQNI